MEAKEKATLPMQLRRWRSEKVIRCLNQTVSAIVGR